MRSGLIAAMAVVALALAGCSSSNAAAPPANGGEHNDADVAFSLGMIPHHQQTIQIADLATKKGSAEQVKVVAAEIMNVEQKEIQTMGGWLRSWNVPGPVAGEHGDMEMPNMLSPKDIKTLEGLSGKAFDAKFLPMVAKHLQNGVTMAKDVLKTGKHKETKDLAGHIVTNQEQQIKEVEALTL
jgi:uncharacterized protein (DUF305 family)